MTVTPAKLEPMVPLSVNAAKLRRRAAVAATLHLGLFGALLVVWTPTLMICVRRLGLHVSLGSGAASIGAGAVEVWLLLIFLRGVADLTKAKLRVVPYFREKQFRTKLNRPASEESSTAFHAGFGIAADLSRLDALSRELRVTPLSSFGFGDDLLKQRPQWSNIEEGLRTLRALIKQLETRGATVPMKAATLTDLKTLAAVLQKAQDSQASFALLLRGGRDDFISGYEMEKREGTFWC